MRQKQRKGKENTIKWKTTSKFLHENGTDGQRCSDLFWGEDEKNRKTSNQILGCGLLNEYTKKYLQFVYLSTDSFTVFCKVLNLRFSTLDDVIGGIEETVTHCEIRSRLEKWRRKREKKAHTPRGKSDKKLV